MRLLEVYGLESRCSVGHFDNNESSLVIFIDADSVFTSIFRQLALTGLQQAVLSRYSLSPLSLLRG